MYNKTERLIRMVYKQWKSEQPQGGKPHPDEEALACFVEGRLSSEESEWIKTHLLGCDYCARILAIQAELCEMQELKVPEELLRKVKGLVKEKNEQFTLEMIFRLKDNLLELLKTTGDVLIGRELVPSPVLRSRQIKDFKDEVVILKDFENIRLTFKLENKQGKAFNLIVWAREKDTQKEIRDLRITLFKDDFELESYHSDSGRGTFENVLLGRYIVEISTIEDRFASVLLDIKA
ncbi:MAG: hypothetical protein V2A64_01040 [Candidatus Omnitrophota bacterium]